MSEYGTDRLNTILAEGASKHGLGYFNMAKALIQVPEEARDDIVSEATIRNNVSGGGTWSGAIAQCVRQYLAGTLNYDHTKANYEMLARERAARDRTGIFVPETTRRAFGHL